MRITLIGRGRVGRGLTAALEAAGREVSLVEGRTANGTIDADVVVLCVPDPSIAATAGRLRLAEGQSVLHCSGSLGADVLPAGSRGVMHPLISFADPARPPTLTGGAFVIDGDPAAVARARELAEAVGGRAVIAAVHGATYHAAAALSANGAAALATVAVRVLESLSMTREEAQRAVGALLRTVGENVERVGVPQALSGPVIRGDDATVRRHRAALEATDPDARVAYDAVAPAILDCARRAGLPEERVEAIRRVLDEPLG